MKKIKFDDIVDGNYIKIYDKKDKSVWDTIYVIVKEKKGDGIKGDVCIPFLEKECKGFNNQGWSFLKGRPRSDNWDYYRLTEKEFFKLFGKLIITEGLKL
jgi:hypothetical protein